MMLLAASQRIFFSQGQRRIWVVFGAPEVLEEETEEEEEDEEETKEESHRTHRMAEYPLEMEKMAPTRLDPTRELRHPQLPKTEGDRLEEAEHPSVLTDASDGL